MSEWTPEMAAQLQSFAQRVRGDWPSGYADGAVLIDAALARIAELESEIARRDAAKRQEADDWWALWEPRP